jgi:hypothetical protein
MYDILVLTHIIGTVLGVGGATFIEILLINALRDGKVTPEESTLMQASYNTLRIGFFLLILSGFGFLILARLTENNQWFYSLQFWAKLSIVGIIALNAALLGLKRIPLLWGSAIGLTSWYATLVLGVLRKAHFDLIGIIVVYIVSIVITYVVLRKIHAHYVTTPTMNVR